MVEAGFEHSSTGVTLIVELAESAESAPTKKQLVGAKRYLRTRMTFSQSLMVPCRCIKI